MGVIASNNDSGCSTCGDNSSTNPGTEFAQNNIGREISLLLFNQADTPTLQQVADLMNQSTWTITEIETPVIVSVTNISNTAGVPLKYIYFFKAGKGKWGTGGTLLAASNFTYITTQNVKPSDVESGNTQTIALGELASDDYLTAANSGERDLSDEGIIYFFSYINFGVLYLVQFVGTNGYYGGSYAARLIQEDFVDTTNDNVPVMPPSIHRPVKVITTATTGYVAGVYTLQASDKDLWLSFNIPAAFQVKVPLLFPANTLLEGDTIGNGQATFIGAAGITLNYAASENPKTAEKYSVFGLKYRTASTVALYGRLEIL